jgi:hypothetical protein
MHTPRSSVAELALAVASPSVPDGLSRTSLALVIRLEAVITTLVLPILRWLFSGCQPGCVVADSIYFRLRASQVVKDDAGPCRVAPSTILLLRLSFLIRLRVWCNLGTTRGA